jgi:hypothetical protein
MPQYLILRLVVLLVLFIGTDVVFSQQQDFLQGRL